MRRKSNTIALLDRARKMCDPPTWYRLSKMTGIKHATISRVRVHGKTLGDINAWKLAKFLGMDAKDVMAYGAEDRAQDDKTRGFWEQQLPRLLSTVAIALALGSSANGGPLTVEKGSASGSSPISQPIYYAKSKLRAWLRHLAQIFSDQGRRQLTLQTA